MAPTLGLIFGLGLVLLIGCASGTGGGAKLERRFATDAAGAAPGTPLTKAETSGYKATSTSAEVQAFIDALRTRDGVAVQSMGKSSGGKDMPVLVLSRHGAFDPLAARALGRPIVMIVANIHAGEVEGKEVVLSLARDVLEGAARAYHQDMTLVLVPNFNPDGNDKISPSNRTMHLKELWGQLGPDEGVGDRQTAEGVDLNRDYILLRAVESENLNTLFHAWSPDVYVDCHTTNGSILAYDLTFDAPHNLDTGIRATSLYARDVLLPEVMRRLEARTGYRTFFYGNFRDNLDPTKGYETYPALARYGANFRGLCGTIDILSETYSYGDFRTRCDVNYEFLREILEFVAANGTDIVRLTAAAKAEVVESGRRAAPDDLVGVSYMNVVRHEDGKVGFEFPVYPLMPWNIASYDAESLKEHRAPGTTLTFWPSVLYARYIATKWVSRPRGYLVRAAATRAIDHLRKHKIRIEPLAAAKTFRRAESYSVLEIVAAGSQIGGFSRRDVVFSVRAERTTLKAEPGDVFVPLDQPLGTLALFLLEPESDDGLARWGFFADQKAGSIFPVHRILAEEGVGGAQ